MMPSARQYALPRKIKSWSGFRVRLAPAGHPYASISGDKSPVLPAATASLAPRCSKSAVIYRNVGTSMSGQQHRTSNVVPGGDPAAASEGHRCCRLDDMGVLPAGGVGARGAYEVFEACRARGAGVGSGGARGAGLGRGVRGSGAGCGVRARLRCRIAVRLGSARTGRLARRRWACSLPARRGDCAGRR